MGGPQPIQLVPKHRFSDISVMVALIKKFQKTKSIYFRILVPGGPPHPVNWSPTHSTGPQTPFFSDISVTVALIKKFQKTKSIYFQIFVPGGPPPHPIISHFVF